MGFPESFGGSEWLRAPKRFLLVLSERPLYFLRPIASFESSGLALLEGSFRDWRRSCPTRGSGFEFSRRVLFREREARKMHTKCTGSCRNLLSIDSQLNRIDPSTNIFLPNLEQGYRTKFEILLEEVFPNSIY